MVESIGEINGQTDIYFVIGDPVKQLKSVSLLNRVLSESEHDINAIFIPLQFSSNDADHVFKSLRSFKNLRGIIVTIPHKNKLLEVCDHSSQRVSLIGAANVAKIDESGQWFCDALDGVGYLNGLLSAGNNPKGKSVQLIGAGGAGSSIAFALADTGVRYINIFDIDKDKARQLANSLATYCSELHIETSGINTSQVDIITNASPVGMGSESEMRIDPSLICSHHLVTDMVMMPEQTPLLTIAAEKGCQTVTGFTALKGQVKAILKFLNIRSDFQSA